MVKNTEKLSKTSILIKNLEKTECDHKNTEINSQICQKNNPIWLNKIEIVISYLKFLTICFYLFIMQTARIVKSTKAEQSKILTIKKIKRSFKIANF